MKQYSRALTKWLADIEECELGLNTKFSSIASISTDSSAGISNLVRNLNLKEEEILNAVSSLLELHIKISYKDLMYALRRRIVQQRQTQSYARNFPKSPISITCFNNNSFSAFDILVEIDNGDSEKWADQTDRCFSVSELLSLNNLLNDCTAVVDSELVLYIPKRLSSKLSNVITQLAAHFPVLIINKPNCPYTHALSRLQRC